MADKNTIYNNLAAGIAAGSVEVCDILKYDNCDLPPSAKESLLDQLAAEKVADAKTPSNERQKILPKSGTLPSVLGANNEAAFDNAGRNLVSLSVTLTKLGDTDAAPPQFTLGTHTHVFTEVGESVTFDVEEGNYLYGNLAVTVPPTLVEGDNELKYAYTYYEI